MRSAEKVCGFLVLILCLPVYVHASPHTHHKGSHQHEHRLSTANHDHHSRDYLIKKNPPLHGNYVCNLVSYSNQCREFEILEGAKTTIEDLKGGCESMGGGSALIYALPKIDSRAVLILFAIIINPM